MSNHQHTPIIGGTSGISGDMTVAALLDLGASEEHLRDQLATLPVGGFEIAVTRVNKHGIDACDFDVQLAEELENHDHDMVWLYGNEAGTEHTHEHEHYHHDHGEHEHEHCHEHDHEAHGHGHEGHHHAHHHHHRSLADVTAIIDDSQLSDGAKRRALAIFTALAAAEAKAHGKSVLVVDKRPNIAGNIYTENIEGINVHKYGAHIFHTNNKKVWNYITRFAEFNRFTNSPVANYKGELYSLPFNMYTFNKMWGVVTPEEAAAKIEEQRKEITGEPKNLEEQAISLVGRDIYEKLIKGYTEKQWGRDCKDLPAFIIKRLPVRLTFDNNYFNALYQGIPIGGYTKMIANLLDGIEVRLNTDYLENKAALDALADKVVYTGPIDAYFDYKLGTLEYRSVRFENELLDKPSFQGNAAVNYTDRETPWTRIIEHKWFEFGKDENGNDLPKTIISREYSSEWKPGDEPYYPVNDAKNGALYAEYKKLADAEPKVIFGGRLGEYKYYDMDQVIAAVLDRCESELH